MTAAPRLTCVVESIRQRFIEVPANAQQATNNLWHEISTNTIKRQASTSKLRMEDSEMDQRPPVESTSLQGVRSRAHTPCKPRSRLLCLKARGVVWEFNIRR